MRTRERAWAAFVGCLIAAALCRAAEADGPAGPPPAEEPKQSNDSKLLEEYSAAPMLRPPEFQAPHMAPEPASGKGRLNLKVGGNRQWCTYRDDRVVQPPPAVEAPKTRQQAHNPVYTFGYQFTIAAVSRSRPAETIMLFESPVVRTTVLRQAAKLGRGGKKPPGPISIAGGSQKQPSVATEQPNTLVPLWQEQLACTTLPEAFDFDLDPGEYDIYMAFDILSRSGAWTHRSIGYLTNIAVVERRRTLLEGRVDMIGGGRRDVDLLSSALLPAAGAGAGAP